MIPKTMVPILVASIATICLPGLASAQTEDPVRSQYHGSKDLPDEIAYQQFLLHVQADSDSQGSRSANAEHHRLLLIATATGHNEYTGRNTSGAAVLARLNRLSAHFERSRQRIDDAQRQAGIDLVCSQQGSIDLPRLFESMNAVDDAGEQAAQRQLQMTLNRLRPGEREALVAYLQDFKAGVSYTKLDSAALFEQQMAGVPDGDREAMVRDQLQRYCGTLLRELPQAAAPDAM